MWVVPSGLLRPVCLLALLLLVSAQFSFSATTWNGVLRDAAGKRVAEAKITLRAEGSGRKYEAITGADGTFSISKIEAGRYALIAETGGKSWTAEKAIDIAGENAVPVNLTLSAQGQTLLVDLPGAGGAVSASRGQHLSSQ